MKKDNVARLIKIKSELSAFPKFKGKAGMVRNISDKLDFLKRYKTEPRIEALLVKEAEKVHGEAIEILSE